MANQNSHRYQTLNPAIASSIPAKLSTLVRVHPRDTLILLRRRCSSFNVNAKQ